LVIYYVMAITTIM